MINRGQATQVDVPAIASFTRRSSTVSAGHQPDHLTRLDIVTNANLDASWLQMRIQCITLAAEIEYHRIALRLREREIARELAGRLLAHIRVGAFVDRNCDCRPPTSQLLALLAPFNFRLTNRKLTSPARKFSSGLNE